jgi:hypothetical protein
MTHHLWLALCLVLVIEGILPFIAPSQWRRVLVTINSLSDGQIRCMGLASMLTGVVLLLALN